MNINSSISEISRIHSLTADFVTNRLSEKGFDNFASSHGNILFQLNKSGKLTMGELSKLINRDKSTTTVLVRKLEKDGLVAFKVSDEDKRSRYVYVTEKGRQYNDITADISSELISTVYKNFSEEEKNQFMGFLEKIKKNLI